MNKWLKELLNKKTTIYFISIASFVIFVLGLYFIADISLFFSIGFTLLLLIHELGHVYAFRKLNMKTEGIYFFPFVGAITRTNEQFKTENDYAYLKYLGPLMGTLGTLITLLLFFFLDDSRFLFLVFLGAFLNLINLIPVVFLDGCGMLRGSIKRIRLLGFLVLCVAGGFYSFMFHAYTFPLFLLLIFTLFSEGPEEATGYKLHEAILASIFIGLMILSSFLEKEFNVWNVTLILLSLYFFGLYIKDTCFDSKKKEKTQEEPPLLPLTKKQKVFWITRWIILTSILLATAFYVNYLLK